MAVIYGDHSDERMIQQYDRKYGAVQQCWSSSLWIDFLRDESFKQVKEIISNYVINFTKYIHVNRLLKKLPRHYKYVADRDRWWMVAVREGYEENPLTPIHKDKQPLNVDDD